MTYEAWRCTFQSDAQAARSAYRQVSELAARVAELEAQIKAARDQRPVAYLHRGSGNDIVEVKIGASLAPVEYRNISPYVPDLPLGRSAPLFTSPIPAEPVNVEFGMRGENMFFQIGNQSFALDYRPEEDGEFGFMRKMLLSAFSKITHGVNMESDPVRLTNEQIKALPKCAWVLADFVRTVESAVLRGNGLLGTDAEAAPDGWQCKKNGD